VLDFDAETVPTLDQIAELPCSVVLPPSWADDFGQQGISPSLPGCKRRFPRMRCRSKDSLIAVEHRQTLPRLPRVHAWVAAYVVNVGRGGVGLLHGEPLYPKELLRIILSDGRPRSIEVVRCDRLDERCYGIGARFVSEGREAKDEG
jgi:hypothetical protein